MAGNNHFSEHVAKVLEAHYQDEQFGLHELAGKLNVSRSQLHRKLVAATGKSATAYIREFRLQKSLELLTNEESTVSEVAYSCGFSSPSYFNTSFSKHFGYPPGEVRNRLVAGSINIKVNGAVPNTILRHADQNENTESPRQFRVLRLLITLISVVGALALISHYTIQNQATAIKKLPSLTSGQSIAVIPFHNNTGYDDMEAICDGITDDLIARLSDYPGFEVVISRISTFQFKDSKATASEIAAALGVSFILFGSLQKSGSGLRLSAQLVDGRSDGHLWSQNYDFDWDSDTIFDIQNLLEQAVLRELNLSQPDTQPNGRRDQPTNSKEAYDMFIQGVYQTYRLDEKSLINAENLLTQAIELDPQFADAYSYLGYVWSARGFGDVLEDQRQAYQQAKHFFSKAHELNPNLWSNELYALQAAFYLDWDFKRLESFYHDGFLRHPYTRETSGLIDYAIKTGRYQDALTSCEQSIRVNPLDAVLYSFKARALWFLGRKKEAIQTLEQTDPLHDKDWFYLREAAHTYYLMREYERCFKILDLLLNHFDDRSPTIVWLDLMRAWKEGNFDMVDSRITELKRAYEKIETGSPAWYIGLYYTARGDLDTGLEWLEKSTARSDVEMTWLQEEPILAPLKDLPRYRALIDRVGFPKNGGS